SLHLRITHIHAGYDTWETLPIQPSEYPADHGRCRREVDESVGLCSLNTVVVSRQALRLPTGRTTRCQRTIAASRGRSRKATGVRIDQHSGTRLTPSLKRLSRFLTLGNRLFYGRSLCKREISIL